MSKKKIIIFAIFSFLFLVGMITGGIFLWLSTPYKVNKDFKKIDLTEVNKVMFVAHPDDDTIWGGGHLIEGSGNYLVVCITCGANKRRVYEFKRVMELTNNKYIMLGYPDKTNGERDNWQTSKPHIIEDIEQILALKKWDLIVTHNPKGEYGHVHHKMTSEMVTYRAEKKKLYYFGKYYTKKNLPDHKDELDLLEESVYDYKVNRLIEEYHSQAFIKSGFDHMFPYENWLTYDEWQEGVEG